MLPIANEALLFADSFRGLPDKYETILYSSAPRHVVGTKYMTTDYTDGVRVRVRRRVSMMPTSSRDQSNMRGQQVKVTTI